MALQNDAPLPFSILFWPEILSGESHQDAQGENNAKTSDDTQEQVEQKKGAKSPGPERDRMENGIE